MKQIAWATVAALLLLTFAWLMGIVGFHYPHVVEDEPLNAPIKVNGIEGHRLYLSDTRVVALRTASEETLRETLSESDFYVEIDGEGSLVTIHARKDGWVCGTPWTQPIRIPLFSETVYRNRRELIGFGELVIDE